MGTVPCGLTARAIGTLRAWISSSLMRVPDHLLRELLLRDKMRKFLCGAWHMVSKWRLARKQKPCYPSFPPLDSGAGFLFETDVFQRAFPPSPPPQPEQWIVSKEDVDVTSSWSLPGFLRDASCFPFQIGFSRAEGSDPTGWLQTLSPQPRLSRGTQRMLFHSQLDADLFREGRVWGWAAWHHILRQRGPGSGLLLPSSPWHAVSSHRRCFIHCPESL